MKWLLLISILTFALAVQSAPTNESGGGGVGRKRKISRSKSMKDIIYADSSSNSLSPTAVVDVHLHPFKVQREDKSKATKAYVEKGAENSIVETTGPVKSSKQRRRKATFIDISNDAGQVPVSTKKTKQPSLKKQKKVTPSEQSHHSFSSQKKTQQDQETGKSYKKGPQPPHSELKKEEVLFEPLSSHKIEQRQDKDKHLVKNYWGPEDLKSWTLDDIPTEEHFNPPSPW